MHESETQSIRRLTYKTREEARRDVFDYIEMFYNPKRKHARNGILSPVELERQSKMIPEGVQKTRGYSLLDHELMGSRRHLISNRPLPRGDG